MLKTILIFHAALATILTNGQTFDKLPEGNPELIKTLENIHQDDKISADSAFTILSNWNTFPNIEKTNKWYIFQIYDSVFGTVPLRVFIPKDYSSSIANPTVLVLHGAVVISNFQDAYKDTASDEDLFYNFFKKRNLIIIRPFADSYGPRSTGKINFDWVVNRFNSRESKNKSNPTYRTLTAILTQLKKVLNIDDNRVFAFGHSDGADGTFALDVYQPNQFAGFLTYNSMLTNLDAYDIYLRNTINRPLYLVHSDLDDLRPINQTRQIVKILDSIKTVLLYKEYFGYQHYDKHLEIDLPGAYTWMTAISRNPYSEYKTWELSNLDNNSCDWLSVTNFDTSLHGAFWQKDLNTKVVNKKDGTFYDLLYYNLNKSAAVSASFNNNIFNIQTSRVRQLSLAISPAMINLKNPVIVKINGKEVFSQYVQADKNEILSCFMHSFDRKAIWVNSLKIAVN